MNVQKINVGSSASQKTNHDQRISFGEHTSDGPSIIHYSEDAQKVVDKYVFKQAKLIYKIFTSLNPKPEFAVRVMNWEGDIDVCLPKELAKKANCDKYKIMNYDKFIKMV